MTFKDDKNAYKPDWAPDKDDDAFAIKVVKGLKSRHDGLSGNSTVKKVKPGIKKAPISVDEHIEGVLANDRVMLAKTITLIESNSKTHQLKAQEVLTKILPQTGNSLRIGITGIPGAGKSTFIETFGQFLIKHGKKVAVLTIDPSSTVTKGSILGDKTRMEKLSREPNCFIRPSPSGGTLGGVARKSRETMLLCEAAGYDVILIETVGVGQSETTVRSMVDFFLLVLIPGGGDELQGIKKGIMELADAVAINKADGELEKKANIAKSDYSNALHYISPATKGWQTQAYTCSSLKGTGIEEIWNVIATFQEKTKESGIFQQRRKEQSLYWVYSMIEEELKHIFYSNPAIKDELPTIKNAVSEGSMLPTTAAEYLLELFGTKKK